MQIHTYTHEQGRKPKEEIIKFEILEIPKPIPKNNGISRKFKAGSWRQWLAEQFYLNELAKFEDKQTNIQFKGALFHKMTNRVCIDNQFAKYKCSISSERHKYNNGNLFSAQPKTILTSLTYGDDHYPIIGGYNKHYYNRYIYFEEVVHRCTHYKIADPRFFEYDVIVEIRNRQIQGEEQWLHWVAPTDKQMLDLRRTFMKDKLYGVVEFPPGFNYHDSPENLEPFKDLR
jgi:hypothetical protein